MTTLKDGLIKGVRNEEVFTAIRDKLAPLLNPAIQDTEEEEALLDSLRSNCDKTLTPFREFLETELPQYDYMYSDVVGFEEGKWSAEVHLMLEEGIYFTESDVELLQSLNRPIWVLTIELSLVFPVCFMDITKMELSETQKDKIDCTGANDRRNEYSYPIFKIKDFLEEAGFNMMPQKSINVIIPREVTEAKIVIGNIYEDYTAAQLLFNELFDDDIDILTFD